MKSLPYYKQGLCRQISSVSLVPKALNSHKNHDCSLSFSLYLKPWHIPVASVCGICLWERHPDWVTISQRLDFVYIPIPYQYNDFRLTSVPGSWKPEHIWSAQKLPFLRLSWKLRWSFKSENNCWYPYMFGELDIVVQKLNALPTSKWREVGGKSSV